MKKLKIFNSLKNKKEEFFPVDPNNIRVYACGPTVYDYAHIGNARMAVVFDTLVRLLRFIYPKVPNFVILFHGLTSDLAALF